VKLLDELDPRLQPALRDEWSRRQSERAEGLPRDVTVVLAGHRAAGKTRLLPHVARLLEREGLDLDVELERRSGRALRDWVTQDQAGFRAAERETFQALPRGGVIAVGGGFLAHHAEVLKGCVVVEIPVSFSTYRERLLADSSRPRLRPELSEEEELREVYTERSGRHAAARPMLLVDFLLHAQRPLRPRRVVTLPPHAAIEPFAWKAKHAGADLLEVRSDLHPAEIDLHAASRALPLLIAQRTPELPPSWRRRASLIDDGNVTALAHPGLAELVEARPTERFLDGPSSTGSDRPVSFHARTDRVVSFHAETPLSTDQALEHWRLLPPGTRIKHVEPLGSPRDFPRLLATQQALIERFGAERVTVLATGPLALPFRAVLAQRNALDYLALESDWAAAPGQRLLADAVREARASRHDGLTRRLGIFGHHVGHSRSPRIHAQPFDRIDLPEDAPMDELLAALRPHYRGFAVTNPFKKRVVKDATVNTLVRRADGWDSTNSDVAGARKVLAGLKQLTVLGDGGVTDALRVAAAEQGVALTVLRREQLTDRPISGTVLWTWPATVEVPSWLHFEEAEVIVIAYGAPAQRIAREIRARGGTPRRLGPRWFIAQARQQRALWETAT
jgi:shikimate kinase